MKIAFVALRLIGFVFFLLLAIGYYRTGLIMNGLISAVVGGLCIAKSEKYPYGWKLKAAMIGVGIVAILILAPK